MSELNIRVRLLHPDACAPQRAHLGDAGADLVSVDDVVLTPGQRAVVGTGIAIEIPVGWVGLVHPRSGLAARYGVTVLNTPGTIDAGYRGEIKVILYNAGSEPVEIARGDRIAQLVIQQVELARFTVVEELSDTARAEGGFGSTGVGSTRPVSSQP
ncbi:MAG: dUTP diphosphatase [Bowdeniella nasicola]|nr:dUTP diphosphatase [Bowdeniella nasicola]